MCSPKRRNLEAPDVPPWEKRLREKIESIRKKTAIHKIIKTVRQGHKKSEKEDREKL